jgi:hypothetical protein
MTALMILLTNLSLLKVLRGRNKKESRSRRREGIKTKTGNEGKEKIKKDQSLKGGKKVEMSVRSEKERIASIIEVKAEIRVKN